MNLEQELILKAMMSVNRYVTAKKLYREVLDVKDKYLKEIENVKKEIVKTVVNERGEVQNIDKLCDVIRMLNGVLDYETDGDICQSGKIFDEEGENE
jgi:flagellin-specific chaperone FliS